MCPYFRDRILVISAMLDTIHSGLRSNVIFNPLGDLINTVYFLLVLRFKYLNEMAELNVHLEFQDLHHAATCILFVYIGF